MTPRRGDVLWAPAPFKEDGRSRPWLVLSTDRHPFDDEESVAATVTTTPHDAAIRLDDEAWRSGGAPRTSYVAPWSVTTLKHAVTEERQGRLDERVVERVVGELAWFLGG
jgi:mRNA-degrading endonuclease toxin of MazEF toxin-antitoxin module